MSQILLGTATFAVVVPALADTSAAGTSTSAAPSAGANAGCGNCAFYTPAGNGESSGTCAFAGGKAVAADDGCGNFTKQ